MRRACALVFLCALLRAQSRPEFIVESVKSSGTSKAYGQKGGPGTGDPGYYSITNWDLDTWVQVAYQSFGDEYTGLPWMKNAKFDLTAKVTPGATRDQLHQMLQVVLEKRFKLKYHRGRKEVPAYKVVIAKGGPKFKAATPAHAANCPANPWEPPTVLPKKDAEGFPMIAEHCGRNSILSIGSMHVRGYGQTMEQIISSFGWVGRRVIDGTGLTGQYDFTLAYSTAASPNLPPEARANSTAEPDGTPTVTIFGAIEKQLGLRLEPSKTIIDFLVVDSIEKSPTAN